MLQARMDTQCRHRHLFCPPRACRRLEEAGSNGGCAAGAQLPCGGGGRRLHVGLWFILAEALGPHCCVLNVLACRHLFLLQWHLLRLRALRIESTYLCCVVLFA